MYKRNMDKMKGAGLRFIVQFYPVVLYIFPTTPTTAVVAGSTNPARPLMRDLEQSQRAQSKCTPQICGRQARGPTPDPVYGRRADHRHLAAKNIQFEISKVGLDDLDTQLTSQISKLAWFTQLEQVE